MKIAIDKQRVRSRFSRAAMSYHSTAVIQGQIAEKMITLLQGFIPMRPDRVLEIGCGTGLFSSLLLQHFLPKHIIFNDISPEMITRVTDMVKSQHPSSQYCFICDDAESCPLPEQLDVIASCSTIQWFERRGSFFARCHSALLENGILAFSTFGEENMREMSATTQVGLSYGSKSELVAELVALGYEILLAEEELLRLYLESPLQVLNHLKQTGVTGITSHGWTKGKLQAYCNAYTARYTVGREVTLTYHPIYIIAKKRKDR
ncbi:malonyl-ACP O-methyltransferase BioC [Sphingobacterium sp. DR205]|uniref:malonyl-ACP O-methyltransferase BioC n=1 Tax=Sphingobacterium sp. DR205 TaxID=2713573 RepID=UPI0019CFD14B|nr:malonyl-ACP O-methyltransferase BioC [Sphingobacterium sp. DR205]